MALAGIGLLLTIALARALTLPDDWYDAYECRQGGRALIGLAPWAGVPVYRSPLFLIVCALGEACGPRAGWLAPALLSVLGYAALLAGCGLLARRLGAPPWAAALLALLAGLDRLAALYAPFGLPDVAAAGACALVLAGAAAPGDGPWPARPVRVGLALGLATLCRQNVGLVGLALLVAVMPFPRPDGPLRPRGSLVRLAVVAAVGAGLYLLVTTLLFAWARGDLGAGWEAHAEYLRFQALQSAENRARYGPLRGWLFSLRALAVASPVLLGLACVGLRAAARERRPAARAPLAWLAVQVATLELLVGHGEARYGMPLVPALVGVGALVLARRGSRPGWLPLALTVILPGLTLALGAPYELRRLLDPVHRGSFSREVAAAARAAVGSEGRFLYTTTWPYGVFPRVLVDPATPYPGDPWHGILHLGPTTLSYHLRAPVVMLSELGAGLRDPARLREFVRTARGFRPGDVLLVGEPRVCLTTTLADDPPGPFGVARVVEGPQGLDLEWRWLSPPGAR